MNYSYFYRNHSVPISFLTFSLVVLTATAGIEYRALAQTTISPKPPTINTQKADSSRLEIIEELSESLANDLLELSVATRDRDLQLTAEFFPAEIAAKPFPSRPASIKNEVKWVGSHLWLTKEIIALK